jgi:hypothetical protein
MGAIGDPVAAGVVPNLTRPGGNVTGFASQNLQLEEKRFEMLRELVPGMAALAAAGLRELHRLIPPLWTFRRIATLGVLSNGKSRAVHGLP